MFEMKNFLVLVVILALVSCVLNRPIRRQRGRGKKNMMNWVKKYMNKYGYLNSSEMALVKDENSPMFKKAMMRLQRFGHVPMTGNIDTETMKLLNKSRCGVQDPDLTGITKRNVGEFNLQGSIWRKKDLTYRIDNFANDPIPPETQRQIFRKALDLWQSASTLRFTEVPKSDDADIIISYDIRDHGDGFPFDGPGGTLAHAFFPSSNQDLSGDAHFDDDEVFTTGTPRGINLDWVAVHEFGHSLGLAHSDVREAIMYPFYTGYVPDIQLNRDDVLGIQELYGAPIVATTQTPTTTESPSTTESPTSTGTSTGVPTTTEQSTTTEPPVTSELPTTTELPITTGSTSTTEIPITTKQPQHPACLPGTRYDAVFSGDKLTYFFSGDQFWTVNNSLEKSDPYKITDFWSDVQCPLDAAFRNENGNIVFFKGGRYWEYRDNNVLLTTGLIRSRYRLRRFARNMDAAFTSRNVTHFIRGSKYWRLSSNRNRWNSPRTIRSRRLRNADAATTWINNNRIYVFKGDSYYRLGKVNRGERYPQSIATRWMRCNGGVGTTEP